MSNDMPHSGKQRPKNEGKSCDAVVKLLERRTRCKRRDVCPHADVGNRKNVELRLRLGAQKYAIEHTEVEAFPCQIRTEKWFLELANPIAAKLSGTLPAPGWYYLGLPFNVAVYVNAKKRKMIQHKRQAVQRALIAWVGEKAKQLYRKNPGRPTKSENLRGYVDTCKETPSDIPFEVVLIRESNWTQPPHHDGQLFVRPFVPNKVKTEHRARLDTALEKKCPKLQSCKDGGAISVLVLEMNDSASNLMLLGEELIRALAGRSDPPDEIFLVDTITEPWFVRVLKRGITLLPNRRAVEFHPDELIDITSSSALNYT
jgi:hypothetical protein